MSELGREDGEGRIVGRLAGVFTPKIVVRAEALIDKLDALVAKADRVLDDAQLLADEGVKLLGLRK